jgi:hypothetical protein
MNLKYEDFHLGILQIDAHRYRGQLYSSPTGEASEDFEPPFDDTQLAMLQRLMDPGDATHDPSGRNLSAIGQQLYRSVFTGSIETQFIRSLDEVKRSNRGLRIRLRLDPPLAAKCIPWELLYSDRTSNFLGLSTRTPLVRHVGLQYPPGSLGVDPPLKVIVVAAAPIDLAALGSDREWRQMDSALEGLQMRDFVTLDRVGIPTLQHLSSLVGTLHHHVLHFTGHGDVNDRLGEAVIYLEGGDGSAQPVTADDLRLILDEDDSLRLVVLNSCGGTTTAFDASWADFASKLIQGGLPAVVAMQSRISDRAAVLFAKEFYRSLARGEPVDTAATHGRRAIRLGGYPAQWAQPVVFMRALDGVLFEVHTESDTNGVDFAETLPNDAKMPRHAERSTTPTRSSGTRVRQNEFLEGVQRHSELVAGLLGFVAASLLTPLVIEPLWNEERRGRLDPIKYWHVYEILIFAIAAVLIGVTVQRVRAWTATALTLGLAFGIAFAALRVGSSDDSPTGVVLGWPAALFGVQLLIMGANSVFRRIRRFRRQSRRV